MTLKESRYSLPVSGKEVTVHWFLHGAAGVLAANVWPDRPELAVTASVLSHYALDRIPHWDPGIASTTVRWKSPEVREFLFTAMPDGVCTITYVWLLLYFVPAMPVWLTLGCALAAVLPDIIDGAAKLSNWPLLQAHRRFHDAIHFNHYELPVSWWWSTTVQIALFAAATVAAFMALKSRGG